MFTDSWKFKNFGNFQKFKCQQKNKILKTVLQQYLTPSGVNPNAVSTDLIEFLRFVSGKFLKVL